MAATAPRSSRTGFLLQSGSADVASVAITLLTLRGLGTIPAVVVGG
jgi:hypothetical protein